MEMTVLTPILVSVPIDLDLLYQACQGLDHQLVIVLPFTERKEASKSCLLRSGTSSKGHGDSKVRRRTSDIYHHHAHLCTPIHKLWLRISCI